jgi:hypothetical protein
MRFSQNKIHSLAEQVVAMLRDDPEARLLGPEGEVELAVAGAIAADLREEAEIDAEVDQVLAEHEREIEIERLDAKLLRAKVKRQIARKRGFMV